MEDILYVLFNIILIIGISIFNIQSLHVIGFSTPGALLSITLPSLALLKFFVFLHTVNVALRSIINVLTGIFTVNLSIS